MKKLDQIIQNTRRNRGKFISVLLPVFNEEQALPHVLDELYTYLPEHAPAYRFEITFVDDCSTDGSFGIIAEYAKRAPGNIKVNVLRLAKNSGSHIAITAAINVCRGDFAIIMASDGQDPASLITELIREWEKDNELILAIRRQNLDQSAFSRGISKLAWRLMSWATKIDISYRGCDVLGLDRKVIDAFNHMDERNTTFIFRILSLGFSRSEVEYDKRVRAGGRSKWNMFRKIAVFIDAAAGFSNRPIKLITHIGLFIFVVLALRWLYVMFTIYVLDQEPSELSIILNTIFTTVAVQILLIGIIGDYIWRILDESRKRPLYEISKAEGGIFEDVNTGTDD